jgi:hypothetical protein
MILASYSPPWFWSLLALMGPPVCVVQARKADVRIHQLCQLAARQRIRPGPGHRHEAGVPGYGRKNTRLRHSHTFLSPSLIALVSARSYFRAIKRRRSDRSPTAVRCRKGLPGQTPRRAARSLRFFLFLRLFYILFSEILVSDGLR